MGYETSSERRSVVGGWVAAGDGEMSRETCECGQPLDPDDGFCRVCMTSDRVTNGGKVLDLMQALKDSLAASKARSAPSSSKSAVAGSVLSSGTPE